MMNKITWNPLELRCDGCAFAIRAGLYEKCAVYPAPEAMWSRLGGCPMATHKSKVAILEKEVNPLKASKRAAKGR